MSVKSSVLQVLEQNRGNSVSGEEIARKLTVSRSAVWKAINSLKQDGYEIYAVTNKGYTLSEQTDIISAEGMHQFLDERTEFLDIRVFKTVTSTNEEAKKCILDGVKDRTIILSEQQTKGKGRMGRSFYSPKGKGIYMSILLRPEMETSNAVMTTTAASVAVCRAIRKLTNLKPEIKWVNDIFLKGKKICGILTEAVSNVETGHIDSVVIGIGVNVITNKQEFPKAIRELAGSLYSEGKSVITRNMLAAEILNQFFRIYERLPERNFLPDYKKWSYVLGKQIRFLEQNVWRQAKAVDIDTDGGLVLELPGRQPLVLRTGEITLRIEEEKECESRDGDKSFHKTSERNIN